MPKRRSKRKKPKSNVLLYSLIGGGVAALLLIMGVILILVLSKGDNDSRVTESNYASVATGSTNAKVEAILGKGRVPRKADFDDLFGGESEYWRNRNLQDRASWEENNARDLVRVWTNGKTRIFLCFSAPPDRGGVVISKILKKPDGSMSSESGMQFANNFPIPNTIPTTPIPLPLPKDPVVPTAKDIFATLSAGELLNAFHSDPLCKYLFKNVRLTGTIKSGLGGFVQLECPEGTIHVFPHPNGVEALSKKKAGETLTIRCHVAAYFAMPRSMHVTNCVLDE